MPDAKIISKPVKTISVCNLEFKISFISTYTHMMVKELSDCYVQANKLMEKFQSLDRENPNYKEKAEKITEEMEAINNRDVIAERLELVKHILEECNNIPFDKNFWLKKTRIVDINDFLYDCLHKDWDKKKEQ